MSDVKCDRCVDLVHPKPDCADCERERIVAANPVPDLAPDFYTEVELRENVAQLAEAWKTATHPQDAMAPIFELADRTSLPRAGAAARGALVPWLEWLTWGHGTAEITTRLRILPAILSAIKQLSPPHDMTGSAATSGPTLGRHE